MMDTSAFNYVVVWLSGALIGFGVAVFIMRERLARELQRERRRMWADLGASGPAGRGTLLHEAGGLVRTQDGCQLGDKR
jgi:hypothetical protein